LKHREGVHHRGTETQRKREPRNGLSRSAVRQWWPAIFILPFIRSLPSLCLRASVVNSPLRGAFGLAPHRPARFDLEVLAQCLLDVRLLRILFFSTVLSSLAAEKEPEPEVAAEQMPRVPAVEPDRAAQTFELRSGFHAELVAGEPLIASPVAMAVDEQGRAYVVEMRDYSERRPEQLGRIRRLEDTDGDGRYDRATVFLEGLPWPTAITCWDGGVFIGATPDILYAKDTNGDGVADVREPVFTGFASDYAPFATNKLNVQALMNSFQWGLDNRIHGATSMSGGRVGLVDSAFTRSWQAATGNHRPVDLRGRDFSFNPRTLELRAESGGGQHGMTFDDAGRKYVCSNSDHLQLIAFEAVEQPSNPFHELPGARGSIAADGPAAEVYRRSPDEPWRVLRTRWRVSGIVQGMVEGGGRASGYFTGATGTTIYRGDAYGPDFAGDAFIGDAGGNLVHRKKLRQTGEGFLRTGERALDEQRSEFLASTDTWFRPVQFYNGPDGCLWVLDMYRETIEHPWSLPANIKARLDLDSGRDRGRIWRLAPDGFKASSARFSLGVTNTAGLVASLADSNGWHRDTASRLLYQRQDTNALPGLLALVRSATNGIGRLQALQALAGFGPVEAATLVFCIEDADPAVQRHAIRLAARRTDGGLRSAMAARAQDPDPEVRLELALALALAHWPVSERIVTLVSLLTQGPQLVQEVALNAVGSAEGEVFSRLAPGSANTQDLSGQRPSMGLTGVARMAGFRNDPATVSTIIGVLSGRRGDWRFAPTAALGEGLRRGGSSLEAADRDHRLEPVLEEVLGALADENETGRQAAVNCLVQFPWPKIRGPLLALLEPSRDAATQELGVRALAQVGDPQAAVALLRALPDLRTEPRRQGVTQLLRRAETTRALLEAVEADRVKPTDFRVEQMNALRSHADPGVRDRARRLFGEPPASRAEVVTQYLPALSQRGDEARGAEVFRERCATCHAFRGTGVVLGPDLASVVSNGQEKLMVSILDPNREVAPNFTAWTAETRSGEVITGILVRESESAVVLKQAGGSETTIERGNLARLRPEGRSLMPEGLETGMSSSDLAGLLAWLTGVN